MGEYDKSSNLLAVTQVLAKLRVSHPDLPVIVLTAKGGIDSAVDAMRAGANDFLVKPASPERITVSIRNQLKIGTLSYQLIRCPQAGHDDPGWTMLFPAGSR